MIKTVKTKSTWQGNMHVALNAGHHNLVIDQPADMGGSDAGPNPMEYFLFSLGGCLASIAAIVAKQEQVVLNGFSIEVDGDYDLDVLMGRTSEGRAGFIEIREKVSIDADLTDEEKEAFFNKVHSRCPVTDSILNKTHIRFELQ